MHGILSSKRHHTFVRRPADAASRQADFSETMDCEQQTFPSIRLMYLYLLGLAQGSPMLDPRAQAVTAAELEWGPFRNKRKRPQHSQDASDSGGNSPGGNLGTKGPNVVCDHTRFKDVPTNNADVDDLERAAGLDGPSAHTRSHDRTPQAQLALLSRKSTKDKHYPNRKWLQMLPIVERPLLDQDAIQIGKHCVVRLSMLFL